MQQAPGAALAYAFLHNLLESLRGQIGLMRQSMKVVTRTMRGRRGNRRAVPHTLVPQDTFAPSYLGRVSISQSTAGRLQFMLPSRNN